MAFSILLCLVAGLFAALMLSMWDRWGLFESPWTNTVAAGSLLPASLNRWIICRTRSGLVCTSRAITSTVFPPAEANTTIARR